MMHASQRVQLNKVSKPQKHGSGSKYYKHYHPMLTAKKQVKHIAFLLKDCYELLK